LLTFANGGDNFGVYVPMFAVAGARGMVAYVLIFLIGVSVMCVAGWYFATRPAVVIAPVVLIGLGVAILIEGGTFGL
jgi:cadmium resistance protein CadD (predicted permease)